MRFGAVIFDLGGVVLGSPLHAIAAYERELEIPAGFINRVVVDTGPGGAWSRLERGELSLDAFYPAFESDCREAGRDISARAMMERMAAASAPRPAMLGAVRRIRDRGLKTAALTNNWETEEPEEGSRALRGHFDAFIESSVVGLRKPDPRIYRHACDEIGVAPGAAVFLDDIGRNLKAARELGMTTVKVEEPDAALAELEALLGFALR
ncbi:MAG: HAD family phosphatase [Myxococcota bacterium]|nr:HAD family phosphatase [Myxococcota bacterium]